MSASILHPAEGTHGKEVEPDSADLTEAFFLGDWRIEPSSRCAYNGATEVKIDPRNFRVLQALADRQGQIVSQREIELLAWEGVVVTSNSLHQSIRQLRQAFGDSKPPAPAKYIETVPRRGYRLVAEVHACSKPGRSVSSTRAATGVMRPRISRLQRWLLLVAAVATLSTVGFGLAGLVLDAEAPTAALQQAERMTADNDMERIPVHMPLDVPALRAQGEFELRRGNPKEAIRSFEEALQLQLAATGERNEDIAYIFAGLALSHSWLGNDSSARAAASRAVAIMNEIAPENAHDRISTLYVLGSLLVFAGEYSHAEQLLNESMVLSRQHYRRGASASFGPIGAFALLRHAQGRLAEAETLAREAVDVAMQSQGVLATSTVHWRSELASILIDRRRFSEAETQSRLAIGALDQQDADGHPYMLSAEFFLAEALVGQGFFSEAQLILRRVMRALESEHADAWRTGRVAGLLGESLMRQGELREADRYLTIAEETLRKAKGWPIEREQRNTRARREQLNVAMRAEQLASAG